MKCLDKTFYPSSHFKSTRQYLNLRSTAVSCQTHACVFKSATTSAGSMLTDCLNIWTGNELLPPLPPPSPWGYNSAAIEYRDTSRTHARIPVHASTHTGARKGRTRTCAHSHTDARKGHTRAHAHLAQSTAMQLTESPLPLAPTSSAAVPSLKTLTSGLNEIDPYSYSLGSFKWLHLKTVVLLCPQGDFEMSDQIYPYYFMT